MAKFKAYDYRQRVFLPVSLADQLMPGILEFAIHTLVETRLDTSAFEQKYRNDETGRTAYDPKILLKIVLLGYARGLISSRKIEQACRESRAKHLSQISFFNSHCHYRQFSPYPQKCQLSFRYLARALVGRMISDVGDRGTPGYRREWQESFRPKGIDIFWLWKVVGSVISFGSGQLALILLPSAHPKA
jgi:hypothetical protein